MSQLLGINLKNFTLKSSKLTYYSQICRCFARSRITGEVCVYDNYTYWGLRTQWLWVGFRARTKKGYDSNSNAKKNPINPTKPVSPLTIPPPHTPLPSHFPPPHTPPSPHFPLGEKSNLIKFDPFWTDLIPKKNQKQKSHFYYFCKCDKFLLEHF